MYTQGPFDIVMDEMGRVVRCGMRPGNSDGRPTSFDRLENSDLTPLKRMRPAAIGHNGLVLPLSNSGSRKPAIEQTAFIDGTSVIINDQ